MASLQEYLATLEKDFHLSPMGQFRAWYNSLHPDRKFELTLQIDNVLEKPRLVHRTPYPGNIDDHFFGDFFYDVPPGHDPVEFVHDNDPFVLPWENEAYVEEFSITAGPVKESAKVEGQVPR